MDDVRDPDRPGRDAQTPDGEREPGTQRRRGSAITVVDGATLGRRAAQRLIAHATTTADPRIELTPGLRPDELDAVEHAWGFEFADDHRAFLAAVLPVSSRWPDWRGGNEAALHAQLSAPVEGVLFDVEHNQVWAAGWGARPAAMSEALAVARRRLASVPRLVPVYAHRCLPAGRGQAGHPVLSVYQTDIIYYGTDLADYIHQEFERPPGTTRDPDWHPRSTVAFWREFL